MKGTMVGGCAGSARRPRGSGTEAPGHDVAPETRPLRERCGWVMRDHAGETANTVAAAEISTTGSPTASFLLHVHGARLLPLADPQRLVPPCTLSCPLGRAMCVPPAGGR